MNILSQNSSKKLNSFQKRSKDALITFTKVVQDLVATNEQITNEVLATEVQIKELSAFAEDLTIQKNANYKVIDKIKSIIED